MPEVQFNVDTTLGALFLGTLAASILYGITSAQVYFYFKYSQKDSTSLKVTVFFLWVLDTIHLAFINRGLYVYLIKNFGNPFTIITDPSWYVTGVVLVTATSDLAVRCVFGRRIWILSNRSILLATTVYISSFFTAGSAIAFAIRSLSTGALTRFNGTSKTMLCLSLSGSIASDTIIAVSLCMLLRKTRTEFKLTASRINVLIIYTINTGLFTGMAATLALVTFVVMPDNCIFIAVYFTLSKLFLNSLLAKLNTRESLRSQGNVIERTRPYTLTPTFLRENTREVCLNRQNPIEITIETVVGKSESVDETSSGVLDGYHATNLQ